MKILVYEDSKKDVDVLQGFLKEFFDERGILYDIRVYNRSFPLYDEVDGADVVFLDIEGMNESGVKVGEFVRYLNKEVRICFMTSFSKYLIDGYRASANRFFLKPLQKEEFFREFEDVLKGYMDKYEGFVDLSLYPKKIYYKDIVYVQYFSRRVILHLKDGRKLYSKDSLNSWKERLSRYWFVQTFRSFLVNGKYIQSYDEWYVYLGKDIRIPLSRNYRKGVEDVFYELIRRAL